MKRAFAVILLSLVLLLAVGCNPKEEPTPASDTDVTVEDGGTKNDDVSASDELASHIYFVRSYVGDSETIGFFYSKDETDLPDAEYVADFECATERPEVQWGTHGGVYLIRDDRYYEYSPLTKEKTVVDGLDTEKHTVKSLTAQTECTEEAGYYFGSDRYFVVTDNESGKEALFDMETKKYLTDFEFSGLTAVSTDRAKDAEFIYGNRDEQFEDQYGTYIGIATTIFRAEPFEVFYDGEELSYPGCSVIDGRIIFYDRNGSTLLLSSDGKTVETDERYESLCFLPDGNFVISGGKRFYVYDPELNLVRNSRKYNKTFGIIGATDMLSFYKYSDTDYIRVYDGGTVMLTDVNETFSVPMYRYDGTSIYNLRFDGEGGKVNTGEYGVRSYEVQTGVDEDGLPVFTEAEIPETLPIGIYYYITDRNLPEGTVGKTIFIAYDTENGTFVRFLTDSKYGFYRMTPGLEN